MGRSFSQKKAISRTNTQRKQPSRTPMQRVLIVCEGAKTEPQYFKKLVEHYEINTAEIKICGEECGSDPMSVVNYALDCPQDDDYEHVFLVFDRDEHVNYDDAIQKAKQTRKRNGQKIEIHLITSVPCFEIWLLLHFGCTTKPYTKIGSKTAAQSVLSDLRKIDEFRDYTKANINYFERIIDKLEDAVKNAKSVINQGKKQNDKNKHHLNPSTYMHELVMILQEIGKEK